MSGIQSVILLGIGIQRKSVDVLVSELGLQENQLLALFNKAIKKLSEHLDSICISAIENAIEKKETSVTDMQPMPISLEVRYLFIHGSFVNFPMLQRKIFEMIHFFEIKLLISLFLSLYFINFVEMELSVK